MTTFTHHHHHETTNHADTPLGVVNIERRKIRAKLTKKMKKKKNYEVILKFSAGENCKI
jgi:hypothetical protein